LRARFVKMRAVCEQVHAFAIAGFPHDVAKRPLRSRRVNTPAGRANRPNEQHAVLRRELGGHMESILRW